MSHDPQSPTPLNRLVPPRRLGRLIASLRELRAETVESAAAATSGLISVARLTELEGGADFATDSELDELSRLYAFDVHDLAPRRMRLVLDFEERLIVAGGFAAVVPKGETVHQVLRRYLTLVWALRGRPEGSHLQLRNLDIDTLGDGLGIGSPAVTSLLAELMGEESWASQRQHPSLMASILPARVAPEAGILLTAGPEGALVFESDPIDLTSPPPAA